MANNAIQVHNIGAMVANAVVLASYEERHFYLAQGLQFTNEYWLGTTPPFLERMPDALLKTNQQNVMSRADPTQPGARRFPGLEQATPAAGAEFVIDKLVVLSPTEFTYASSAQRVRYRVTIINKKKQFKEALEKPDVGVVYAGHSRYGRGPCFGLVPPDYANPPENVPPGEHWSDMVGSSDDEKANAGIFHMGYPFMGIPTKEIMSHGYTFSPTLETVKIKATDCHPGSRNSKKIKHEGVLLKPQFKRDLKRILRGESTFTNNLSEAQRRQSYDDNKRYWSYRIKDDEEDKHASLAYPLLRSGWKDTLSKPYDLGGTAIACKVLCLFSCSSHGHFSWILRGPKNKNWVQESEKGYAYFTTRTAYEVAPYWFYYLFTYSNENARKPWGPSLDFAGKETNKAFKRIQDEELALKNENARRKRRGLAPLGEVLNYSYRICSNSLKPL